MFDSRPISLLLLPILATLAGCQGLWPNHSGTGGAGSVKRPALSNRCPDGAPRTDAVVAQSINASVERLTALKTSRSLSNDDVCTMPDAALKRAFSRLDKPKADHPGDWAEFRNLQRRSEDGKVKPDGLIQGLMHRKDMLHRQQGKPQGTQEQGAAAVAAADAGSAVTGEVTAAGAGVAVNAWNSLGPGNIGGRIRTILIHPTDTNRIWVGSVAGGIWNTTDGGASWHPVNDFLGTLSVSSLVMDPNNPNIIYAGTGEGFFNSDAVRGAGVFKSADGGATWNQLPSTIPSSDTSNSAYNWFYVNRLAISKDGSVILAATRGATNTSGAIFRSSDAGASWTKVYSGAPVWDVRCDPNDSSKMVATGSGPSARPGYSNSYFLRSTNGGITWSSATLAGGRAELAYAKSDSRVVYASRTGDTGTAGAGGIIYKSVDGGASYSYVSPPGHLGSQGWYDNTIWVDPTNPNHVVIGGLDLWRSTDGGVTWTKISNWVNNMYNGYPDVPHADHHALVSDPNYNGTTNKTLYGGNDGGIFRAADISLATETSGWQSLNKGLAITLFYSGVGRTSAGGRVVGGTQDNGSLVTSGGTNWQMASGGDGGYSAVDSQNDNYIYGEYVYLQLHRATDGLNASSIYSGISEAGSSSYSNFIAPFVLDPNDNNRLLAGGRQLWQSVAVKAPVPSWASIKASTGSNISSITVAEGNSSTVWVGHNDGKVYRTTNSLAATPTWTQVGSGVLPARMVNRILIDKDAPERVYVAFGGYNSNNLYRTVDSGATWTNITGTLPAVPIFSLARHPQNGDVLYAGTEVGLYTSENGGSTWYTDNDGPATVEISELSWLNDSTLLAATHGRGMFQASASLPADVTAPTVTTFAPVAGGANIAPTVPIVASFSEPMDGNSVTLGSFSVDPQVAGTVSYNAATRSATFTPSIPLAYSTTYTVTINTAARDVAGNGLAMPKTWSFTTVAPQIAPVRLLSPAVTSYQSIQTAYAAAATGNILELLAASFNESLIFNSDVAIYLRGGFDDGFTSNSGYAILTGNLAVKTGTVKVENVRFR